MLSVNSIRETLVLVLVLIYFVNNNGKVIMNRCELNWILLSFCSGDV